MYWKLTGQFTCSYFIGAGSHNIRTRVSVSLNTTANDEYVLAAPVHYLSSSLVRGSMSVRKRKEQKPKIGQRTAHLYLPCPAGYFRRTAPLRRLTPHYYFSELTKAFAYILVLHAPSPCCWDTAPAIGVPHHVIECVNVFFYHL